MPIELKENEEVLATDQVLHYSSSFFAHNADCWLTNQRLMLEPKKALDKLSGSKAEVKITEISNIENKSGMITIHHANGTLQIGGSGAERVSERLGLILDTIAQGETTLEKVLFQGDTNVYIKGPLSTKGEIILTSKNLTIRTTDGLESYIFDKKELNTTLVDILNLEFSNLDQKLTIHTKQDRIVIGGKNAARLNTTLRGLEGTDVEELENVAVEQLSAFEAMLYRGASKSAINGELSFSPNRVTFSPQNVLDTLTGAQLQIIPFDQIQKISKKGRLEITTLSNKLVFVTNKSEDIYEILEKEILKIKRPKLFTDIRSKLYSEDLAFSEVKELTLPFKHYSETPILCDQCTIQKSEGSCYFAYVFVTEEKTRLLTPNKQLLWEGSNKDVSIVENRNTNDATVQIKLKEQRIKFKPYSGLPFRNFYTRKLKESRPSEAEQFSKENQPVQRILGYTNQVEISYNGEVINTILNTRVSAENRGIQVNSDKINDFPCQIGDKLQIEVPKKEGRYRFQSVITEQYLVEPDPIGRYYVTLAIPSNIALFNDRGAYRAPFEQELMITVVKLPEYDPEREEPLDFLDQAQDIEKTLIHLLDLSVSGCGFLIRRSILKHNVEMHCLAFKGEIEVNGEMIPWVAIPKYEVPFTQNKVEFKRVGGQFIGMNNLDRSIINRAVLKIERDQLRKEMERKED